ncbi:MAG: glycosyl hydrolase family 18 protein [Candidatus Limnocylindrales bacterium]
MQRPRPLHRAATAGLALLLAVLVLPAAPMVGSGSPVRAATEIRPRITGIAPLSHEVFGYLPYWRLDANTAGRIDYRLVSTIAFFGIGIFGTGALDRDWVGYREYVGEDAAAVTNAAHDQGVRVVPTFQLFDSADGAPRMTKFLDSTTNQDRFIAEALDLMAARKADGASLDFEPVKAVNARADKYVAFVARFRTAMLARFPDSTLVNATSAGANQTTVEGLVPHVDRQMIMTYNYRWTGSTRTGAIAPLDNTTRTVKIHIAKMLQWAPAGRILMGVPYYGYDWPVTSAVPNATVQSDKATFGAVKTMTYASARAFLAAHPEVVRQYDALEGSGFYTYWSTKYGTYRQVYFEEERSLADKYDYAIATGLAGVGIWTLGNDAGYTELWDVLRSKFYAPVRQIAVGGRIADVFRRSGVVYAVVKVRARETGTIPERGAFRWTIRDAAGRLIRYGSWPRETLYPGRLATHRVTVRLGTASALRAGTWTIRVRFITSAKTWRSPVIEFRQRY